MFLDKQQASSLISRQRRNAEGSTLEKVCMEKVCTYEQARAFFQDSYRTVSFGNSHFAGDALRPRPQLCVFSLAGHLLGGLRR